MCPAAAAAAAAAERPDADGRQLVSLDLLGRQPAHHQAGRQGRPNHGRVRKGPRRGDADRARA
eukprot:6706443-Prymnesium_polylepis.1